MDIVFETLKWVVPLCGISYAYYAIRAKTPLVVTQQAAQDAILDFLKTEMKDNPTGQNLKIYDLGSGLGGLCFGTAQTFPNADVHGWEMAWPTWMASFLRQICSPLKNIKFHLGDFWDHDFSDADIILCYLGVPHMPLLKEKFRKEAKAGRLIISNTFPLPEDWQPEKTLHIPVHLSKNIYIYRQ